MRASFLVLLALVTAVPAHGEPVSATEAWRPVRVFIGSWSGTRKGPESAVKVSRQVGSSDDNRQLVVSERSGGRSESATWGTIAFDPALGTLVLRAHGERAGEPDLVLEATDPEATRLVFATPAGSPRTVRLTYERLGWNELVERLEEAPAGGQFALVAETRFKRGAPKIAFHAVPKALPERSASR